MNARNGRKEGREENKGMEGRKEQRKGGTECFNERKEGKGRKEHLHTCIYI
jgi:hypothetical protein